MFIVHPFLVLIVISVKKMFSENNLIDEIF